MDAGPRRVLLATLAAVAVLALGAAGVTVALAPDATPLLLAALLGVVVLVVVAEVVVLVLDRRKPAPRRNEGRP